MGQNQMNPESARRFSVEADRLKRLLSYYLECIEKDQSTEVSFFTNESQVQNWIDVSGGDELSRLAPESLHHRISSSKEMLAFLRASGNLSRQGYYYGYPIFLNAGKAQRTGRRYTKVEPLFYRKLEPPKAGSQAWTWADAPAEINPAALKALAPSPEEARQLRSALNWGEVETTAMNLTELSARLTEEAGGSIWQEGDGSGPLVSGTELGDHCEGGLYHRAMLFKMEPSGYTQGLEKELRAIADRAANCGGTALATLLGSEASGRSTDSTVISHAVPLNAHQAAAVRSALSGPWTVITGPPGTGKSQVVTSIIVNAALRGQSVLFASRNHKAVDVVLDRANGLVSRPLVLKLVNVGGAQEVLPAYIASLLAQAQDPQSSAAKLKLDQELTGLGSQRMDQVASIERLERQLANADRCEQELESYREALRTTVETILKVLRATSKGALDLLQRRMGIIHALGRLPFGHKLIRVGRPWWKHWLSESIQQSTALANTMGLNLPEPDKLDFEGVDRAILKLAQFLPILKAVEAYGESLDALNADSDLDSLQKVLINIDTELAVKGLEYLKLWSYCLADGISGSDRQALSNYQAGLRTLAAGDIPKDAYAKLARSMDLAFAQISKFVPAWSVTNLSARGRVPFSPAMFDLVVIDEASQCDIPSALPLLYRAKRAVIIGDPNQLQHITQLRPAKDLGLRSRHGLDGFQHAAFGYSNNSLFDVSQSVVQPGAVVELTEHHRSHSSIIDFSNQHFYQGRLTVVTDYRRLKPDQDAVGLRWVDVIGRSTRPSTGGAINDTEAKAVAEQVVALIKERKYAGSIGVTTPFRLQANRIRELLNQVLSPAEVESHSLIVDVVHKFQGDERDCMFFSPVVSEGVHAKSLGFLSSNGSLFNVAVTRARSLLIVVGDRDRCASCGVPYLEKFADHAAHEQRAQAAMPGQEGPFESSWERVLFERLQTEGLKPLPQYQEGLYRLDLALIEGPTKLDIEVDGERYHRDWNGNLNGRDLVRNMRLQEQGWQVLRFWVYQVRDDLDACIDRVRATLVERGN